MRIRIRAAPGSFFAADRELSVSPLPQPVIPRGKPGDFRELAGEIVAVVEADIEGDLSDAAVAVAEQTARAVDALADDPSERGGAGGGLENSQETALGHVGDAGQFLQIHLAVDVPL